VITSPSVPFIPVTGKTFYDLGLDGEFLNGEKIKVPLKGVATQPRVKVEVILDLFMKSDRGPEALKKNVVCHISGVTLSNFCVRIIDLNRAEDARIPDEHAEIAFGVAFSVNTLSISKVLNIVIPKYKDEDSQVKDVRWKVCYQPYSVYQHPISPHPDVAHLYDTFMQICNRCSTKISKDEIQDLKKVVIPNLLGAKDVLIGLRKEGAFPTQVLKISGKPRAEGDSKAQSRYLFFPGHHEEPHRYASVKIFPNEMVVFHIKPYRINNGSVKKLSYKVVLMPGDSSFGVMVKSSPKKECLQSPLKLSLIEHDWDMVYRFSHPNIIDYKMRFSNVEVYLDPYTDFYNFLAEDFSHLLDKCTSVSDCMYLLNQLVEVMIGIAKGLDYIHGKGILHLDIKPENVLIDVDESGERVKLTPKIIDFGFAVEEKKVNQTTAPFCGTSDYYIYRAMASKGRDLYALGSTYEYLNETVYGSFLLKLKGFGEISKDSEEKFRHFIRELQGLIQQIMIVKQFRRAFSGELVKEYKPGATLKDVISCLEKLMA